MIYIWEDENTKFRIEVMRRMSESDEKPYFTECVIYDMTKEQYKKAKWKKIITGGLGHVGFGQKGSW